MKGQPIMNENSKETTKYYWLKLERGFFKRHDITYIERAGGYPDGLLMGYFYMKLLAESIDHNGMLRFSVEKPYNDPMLAAITGIDVRVVEKSMALFKDLALVEVYEDGTIHMLKVDKMLGVGSSTERVKKWREKQKEAQTDEVEVVQPIKEPIKKKKELKSPTMKNDEMFEQFWDAYPRKVGKDKCQKWFKVRKITQEFVDDLVLAITQQKKSESWKDVQFIPHPYTWLNRGGWNDELTYAVPIEKKITNRWEAFINGKDE
jgi:predicted phage replisome organizer